MLPLLFWLSYSDFRQYFNLLPKRSFFLPHPSYRKLISFQQPKKYTYISCSLPRNPLIYWAFLSSNTTVSTCGEINALYYIAVLYALLHNRFKLFFFTKNKIFSLRNRGGFSFSKIQY